MVEVTRMSILIPVFYVGLYIFLHWLTFKFKDKFTRELEKKPGDEDTKVALKVSTFLSKYFHFVYLVFIIIVMMS